VRPPSRPAITRTLGPDARDRSKGDLQLQSSTRVRYGRREAPARLRCRRRSSFVGRQEIDPGSRRNGAQAEENVLQHLKGRRLAAEVLHLGRRRRANDRLRRVRVGPGVVANVIARGKLVLITSMPKAILYW